MNEKTTIFIKHMLENIKKIESFSKEMSKEDLRNDELKQYAIVRAIEVIGEAAKNLPEDFKEKNPNISWKEIIGTKDLIIHKYFGLDLDIVWNIIKIDLPDLKRNLDKIIK